MLAIVRSRCTFAVVLLWSFLAGAQQQGIWRYDLRPGDHLVYSQEFVREVHGSEVETASRLRFTNHVLVAAENGGMVAVGFQRNRDSAELLAYRSKGKDELARQRPEFFNRLAQKSPHFSESNLFLADGTAQDSWQAVREAVSRVLLGVHEIVPLPRAVLKPGDTWTASDLFAFQYHFERTEPVGDETCALISVAESTKQVRLRFWFCPSSGIVARLEFEADYPVVGAQVHETLSLRLKQRTRGESMANWLSSADTQQAALRAVLQAYWVPVSAEAVAPLYESTDPATAALALAVADRHGWQIKPALVTRLSNSNSARVRQMVARRDHPGANPLPMTVLKPGATLRFTQLSPSYPYILHIPENYRGDVASPLLVYLSGGPGLAIDAANGSEDALADSGYIVLYPDARGDMWWTPAVTDRFPALLDEVLRSVNIDRRRIYLAGFSNGGTGAIYYASLWPERFAAVVSLMGAGTCLPELQPDVRKLAGMPVLLVHGNHDPIIPVHCSEDLFKTLRKLSPAVPPQLHILKNRQHDIRIGSDDGLTLQFLDDIEKRRGPTHD